MTGASLVQAAASAGAFTRRLARATGRVSDPPAPSVTAAPDVRAELRDVGAAMHDAVASASRMAAATTEAYASGTQRSAGLAAATEPVAAAVKTLNQVLDTLGSRDLSLDFQVSIANAVREAVAGVTHAAASGLTVTRIEGKEKLVIDTAALAEALANDPHALRAFVTGEEGLPQAFSVALAADSKKVAPEKAPPATVVEVAREAVDMVRSAAMAAQLRTLQLLDALPTARHLRLDILV